MNKKEIKTKVAELLSVGTPKAQVFAQLSGQGVKDSQVAYFIAAYPDPIRCEKHRGKVNALVTIMLIQAVMAFLIGQTIGAKIVPNAQWIITLLSTAIALLFAWGFYANRVGAYNGYILLSLLQQAPNVIASFKTPSLASSIGAVLGMVLIGYVLYVRENIFPGFVMTMPRKVKGEYVFVD